MDLESSFMDAGTNSGTANATVETLWTLLKQKLQLEQQKRKEWKAPAEFPPSELVCEQDDTISDVTMDVALCLRGDERINLDWDIESRPDDDDDEEEAGSRPPQRPEPSEGGNSSVPGIRPDRVFTSHRSGEPDAARGKHTNIFVAHPSLYGSNQAGSLKPQTPARADSKTGGTYRPAARVTPYIDGQTSIALAASHSQIALTQCRKNHGSNGRQFAPSAGQYSDNSYHPRTSHFDDDNSRHTRNPKCNQAGRSHIVCHPASGPSIHPDAASSGRYSNSNIDGETVESVGEGAYQNRCHHLVEPCIGTEAEDQRLALHLQSLEILNASNQNQIMHTRIRTLGVGPGQENVHDAVYHAATETASPPSHVDNTVSRTDRTAIMDSSHGDSSSCLTAGGSPTTSSPRGVVAESGALTGRQQEQLQADRPFLLGCTWLCRHLMDGIETVSWVVKRCFGYM